MKVPNPTETPTLNAKQVAELWGVSDWQVYETHKRGECPVEPLTIGRCLRWPTAKVLASVGLGGEG
jgi:predicted DNA-binding transcriptional regulator AlpA